MRVALRSRSVRMNVVRNAGGRLSFLRTKGSRSSAFHCPSPLSAGTTQAALYWSASTGAHWLNGPIWSRYRSIGADSSQLGLPTTDLTTTSTGAVCQFQGGTITWTSATNTTVVTYG